MNKPCFNLNWLILPLSFFCWDWVFAQSVPVNFAIVDINSNLDGDAIGFDLLPDGRILIISQFSGQVKLVVNGNLKSTPLLTLSNLANRLEKGLLGIAVDPDFPTQPFIYLFHSYAGEPDSNRVSRFTVEGDLSDPNSDSLTIDPSSQFTLIDDMPAENDYHNGGTIRFGTDKKLYISHGDDGNRNLAQDLTTLNGKVLRLNSDGTIPLDNPVFPNEPQGKRDEIFAFGLRNPFRFSIDPQTNQIFLADVGQDSSEEINLFSNMGGENLGWPRYEGTLDFDVNAILSPPAPVFPIWEYLLSGQNSVIGLVAYRQQNFPNDFSFPSEYDGNFFYADFYHDEIYNLRPDGSGGWINISFATGFSNLVDGTLGSDGSLFILEYGRSIKKIVYLGDPVPVELSFFKADVNKDKVVLTWQTESESNNFGFEIQCRFSEATFEKIVFIKGSGTSSQPLHYSFEDSNIVIGTLFYRLK